MEKEKTVVYDCTLCGNEITVTADRTSNVSPVYCCGTKASRKKKTPRKKTPSSTRTMSKKKS